MTTTPLPQTPSPTATMQSTRTATIDPATRATMTQRAQMYAVTETAVAGFPQTCEGTYSNTESISPGGNWLASSCGYKRDQSLEIVNRNEIKYTILLKDYLDGHFVDGSPPMGSLYPVQYMDEEYLYFYAVAGYSGGGTCYYGVGVHGVYRLDLNTGAVSVILPQTLSMDGYLIAFSPDGRTLVYNHYDIPDPVLLDLITGEKIPLNTDEAPAGNFTWSPDGEKLAYATCKSTDFSKIDRATIRIYDPESGETSVILELEDHFLEIEDWDEEGLLTILDVDYRKGNDIYWYFDWNAGQLSVPTPEPKP